MAPWLELSQFEPSNQESLLRHSHGCRIPRPWSILEFFTRLQAGNFMGNVAAMTQTGTLGSWCLQGKYLGTEGHVVPSKDSLLKSILSSYQNIWYAANLTIVPCIDTIYPSLWNTWNFFFIWKKSLTDRCSFVVQHWYHILLW